MTEWTLARIRDYYRKHASLVADQLAGREVTTYPPGGPSLSISSPAEVLAAADRGVGGFLISPNQAGQLLLDRAVIDLRPGEGTDVATAATVALSLGDRFAELDWRPIVMLNGQGGLIMLLPQPPTAADLTLERLAPVLAGFAEAAPELATLAAARADGRVLLSSSATAVGRASWAPYSLVPGHWPGVVMPLHRDDIAAASAGMPLEIEPEDVLERISLRGDLTSRRVW